VLTNYAYNTAGDLLAADYSYDPATGELLTMHPTENRLALVFHRR